MNLRALTSRFHSADIVIIGFFGFLTTLNLMFAPRIPHWKSLVAINCIVIAAVYLLASARQATGSKVLRFAHDWYVIPMVVFSYKELYYMIRPIHFGVDYDDVLIAIDRWLFGVDPTVWLARFAHPAITEILQIAYTLFFVLFLVVGFELYRRHNLDLFHYFIFAGAYGFFLSYLGYFLLPAVGPRFTLHDFSALDRELPGLWLTPYLRWFVNTGESIPTGVSNAVALAVTQRDVFPSGHTMMTMVAMFFGARYRLRARWFVYCTGFLLIMATVYQRYHYAVDLIGGAAFALICLTTAPGLYMLVKHHFQTIESRFPAA
jgi:membrane-associated phospholipid phosphatase